MKGVMKNPLTDNPDQPAAKEKRRESQFLDEFEIPLTRDFRTVAFPGRTLTISVEAEGENAEADAKATLGTVMAAYLKKHPEVFKSQSLSTTPPLAPSVAFQLGKITLHAVAGSTIPETARKMAVDRLGIVLTAAKSTSIGRVLLAQHKITVSRKA